MLNRIQLEKQFREQKSFYYLLKGIQCHQVSGVFYISVGHTLCWDTGIMKNLVKKCLSGEAYPVKESCAQMIGLKWMKMDFYTSLVELMILLKQGVKKSVPQKLKTSYIKLME